MRKNKALIIFEVLILIGIISIIAYKSFFMEKQENNNYEYSDYYEYNGKKYEKNDDLELILFAGLDSYDNQIVDSYRNDNLADCVVLLVLNKEDKTVLPIQINRDTMCNYHILGIGGRITGDGYGQLALSHSYGSGDIGSLINVKDAVSNLLTGINIDYYISMTMDAVSIVNDEAGGVEVFVEDDFSGIDNSIIMGELNTLTGNHALTFVRSRRGLDDSSNLARMNRQKVYLRALYDKCKTLALKDNDFVYRTLNSVGEYIIANTNIYGLSDICNTLIDYKLLESVKLDGKAIIGNEGYIEYYIDDNYLKDFCIKTFYKQVK